MRKVGKRGSPLVAYMGVAAGTLWHWFLIDRGNDVDQLLDLLSPRMGGTRVQGLVIRIGEGATVYERTDTHYPNGLSGRDLVKLLHGSIEGSIGPSLANPQSTGKGHDVTFRSTHGGRHWPFEVIANGESHGVVIKSGSGRWAGKRHDNTQGPWFSTRMEAANWLIYGESNPAMSYGTLSSRIEGSIGPSLANPSRKLTEAEVGWAKEHLRVNKGRAMHDLQGRPLEGLAVGTRVQFKGQSLVVYDVDALASASRGVTLVLYDQANQIMYTKVGVDELDKTGLANPTWSESERWFEQAVSDLTDEAFKIMFRWPYGVYVYHRPATASEYGEFFVVPDGDEAPEGTDLSWSEKLPRNLARDQLRAWIWKRSRRLPLLPHGKPNPAGDVVFYARTRGKRYEIVVTQDEDGTYSADFLTRGKSAGRATGYNVQQMKQRIQQEIMGAADIDGINYIVEQDGLGVQVTQNPAMTYGTLPPRAEFDHAFEATLGEDGLYQMHLRGSDLRAMQHTAESFVAPRDVTEALDRVFSGAEAWLDVDELWLLVGALVDAEQQGHDDAGSLASSIMETLEFEWV